MSSSKDSIFDNEYVTSLVIQYNTNGGDVTTLNEIFSESKSLLSVIATKYCNGDDDLKEELMQEARIQLIKALPRYDPDRNKKLFSYVSAVARNCMVDVVRKFRPEIDIEDIPELDDYQQDELDYISTLVEDLRRWFKDRFENTVRYYIATEVLECIISDLVDQAVGSRTAIEHLAVDYGYSKRKSRILFEAVNAKLRIRSNMRLGYELLTSEDSLHPELLEAIGEDAYRKAQIALAGYSVRFPSINSIKEAHDGS